MQEEDKMVPSGYVPPKKWVDLTDSEKIERNKEYIKSLLSIVGNLQRKMNSMSTLLQKHQHLDGKVVKEVGYQDLDGNNCLGGVAMCETGHY